MSATSDKNHSSLVIALLNKGDKLLDKGEFFEAKDIYLQALNLLNSGDQADPQLFKDVLMAIGDVSYLTQQYQDCIEYLSLYLELSQGASSPILNLRLGQSLFETGDIAGGWEYLFRAFISGGNDLFTGEDNKYLIFVQENQKLRPE
jgi:tetratricopeptide (TPR) repeat protein